MKSNEIKPSEKSLSILCFGLDKERLSIHLYNSSNKLSSNCISHDIISEFFCYNLSIFMFDLFDFLTVDFKNNQNQISPFFFSLKEKEEKQKKREILFGS